MRSSEKAQPPPSTPPDGSGHPLRVRTKAPKTSRTYQPAAQSPFYPVYLCNVEQYEIDLESPDELGISSAVQTMKKIKPPREDDIPPEVFKFCVPTLLSPQAKLFGRIWDSQTFPKD